MMHDMDDMVAKSILWMLLVVTIIGLLSGDKNFADKIRKRHDREKGGTP